MTDRPRFVINCDGTKSEPHEPAVVMVYARDSDGTWLPIHSAIRHGKQLILPESGYLPDSNQFDLPCPEHNCEYRFRHPVDRVSEVLDKLLAAGELEASLRFLDAALRRHAP